MTFKKIIALLLAVLMAAALIAFAACSGKDKDKDDDDNVDAGEVEATEEPTPEPVSPYAKFDDAFDRLNAFVATPDASTLRGVFPDDYFNALETMLSDSLAELGMSIEDLGYESFDEMIGEMISADDIAETFTIEESGSRVVRIDFDIKSCEESSVDELIDSIGSEIMEYLDASQFTEAYRLVCDVTAVCEDGSSQTEEDQDVNIYMYDGKYYIAFIDEFGDDNESGDDDLFGDDDPADNPRSESIDDAFNALNRFVMDPTIESLKGVYPEEFFDNFEAYIVELLAEQDMELSDLGYADFDAFLESIFDPEEMKDLMVSDTIGKISNIEWTITSCEEVEVSEILEMFGETFDYLDASKLTAGYKVKADMVAVGENGQTETSPNEDVYIYVYDGQYYILFN